MGQVGMAVAYSVMIQVSNISEVTYSWDKLVWRSPIAL